MTSSHRVPLFPSWNSLLRLLSWILQSDIWELIEGYGQKGNILRAKMERSLLRNCIAMCECISQSYTFLFSHQFANTVFWKSAMGCFLAQWSLRWQRKYPQWKIRKKLSWTLLGEVWIHRTEFHLYFLEQWITTVFEEPEKGFFGSHWGLRWERKYHHFKTWKKLSEKLLYDLGIHVTVLQLSTQDTVC